MTSFVTWTSTSNSIAKLAREMGYEGKVKNEICERKWITEECGDNTWFYHECFRSRRKRFKRRWMLWITCTFSLDTPYCRSFFFLSLDAPIHKNPFFNLLDLFVWAILWFLGCDRTAPWQTTFCTALVWRGFETRSRNLFAAFWQSIKHYKWVVANLRNGSPPTKATLRHPPLS
jgi:hypothetical protein